MAAGALYFLIVFAVGFVLGPIRELLLAPRLGPVAATLIEAPFMIVASALAAKWVVRRLRVSSACGSRLGMGATALFLLLAAELAGSMLLRGLTVPGYLVRLARPEGLLALALFSAFAAMPLLVGRR